jgi:hypothetical protein
MELISRLFKPELFSDQITESILNFRMARDRGFFSVVGIHVNVVVGSMTF